jgi:hypothetical protein
VRYAIFIIWLESRTKDLVKSCIEGLRCADHVNLLSTEELSW